MARAKVMMKVHEPPKLATLIRDPLTEGHVGFNDVVGIAAGAHSHQLLGGVKLAAQHGQHVHPGMRFALQQVGNIIAVHFQAHRFCKGDGLGLVRRLLQHGSEAKELAFGRLIDHDFLMVLIHGRDPDGAGYHHISSPTRVADLPDALARNKGFDFNLSRQNCGFIVVQQGKQGNASQYLWAARHGSPRQAEWSAPDPSRRMS